MAKYPSLMNMSQEIIDFRYATADRTKGRSLLDFKQPLNPQGQKVVETADPEEASSLVEGFTRKRSPSDFIRRKGHTPKAQHRKQPINPANEVFLPLGTAR